MKTIAIILIFISSCIAVHGQQQQNPCSSEKAHQFDFWIGEWNVYKYGTDTLIGHNVIKPIAEGCALLESWNSVDNSSIGNSLNKYNFRTGKWQQFWVDNQGSTLEITGEYKDSKMVMEGETRSQSGTGSVCNRITWYNNADGTVRQYWDYTTDEGKTWLPAFDGHYKKVKG